MILDRAGGGIFGAITGLIVVGVTAGAIQMLPFSFKFLGHGRFVMYDTKTGAPVKLDLEEKQSLEDLTSKLDFNNIEMRRESLWLSPDDFAVAVARHLSSNALQGEVDMAAVRPNPLDDAQWARFNPAGQKSTTAKANSVSVEAAWQVPENQVMVLQAVEGQATSTGATKAKLVKATKPRDKLEAGNRYVVVRVKMDSSALDGSAFRFSTGQVVLMAKLPSGKMAAYRLVGINADPEKVSTRKGVYMRLPEGSSVVRPATSSRMDWVFSIPEGAMPQFVEYKLNARDEVPALKEEAQPLLSAGGSAKPKPKPEGGDQSGDSNSGGGSNGGNNDGAATASDRISRVHPNTSGSFFGEELPFTLTTYSDTGLEHSGETIINGKLTAPLDQKDEPIPGNQAPLSKLTCPPGKRLLHLSVARTIPRSLYGQVRDFTAQNNNCAILDEVGGREYEAVGVYAIATVGGQRIFDLQFIGPEYRVGSAAVPKLNKVRSMHMERGSDSTTCSKSLPGPSSPALRPRGVRKTPSRHL